jgi:AcrR family transcriptional regulator
MAVASPVRIPSPDRREQILDVAMELFARLGFRGTTTRRIAEDARVNEAIIFRHFPTKEDLYWAIIDRKCRTAGRTRMVRDHLRGGGTDREVFIRIAEGILNSSEQDTNMTRLLLYTALENHELSHRFFKLHVAERYERLADYIRQRISDGTFRDVNPLLAARGFLGMLVYHNWIDELFGGSKYQKFSSRETAETIVDIWLQGMVTRSNAKHRTRQPKQTSRATNSRNGASHSSRPRRQKKIAATGAIQ